ncbi:MAG: fibrobacter succinogenes major paralogous domain-containing protein [Fibrobacter sp.]|nr:fibrobacter succinogenes major paralogous domain-containing protein [Fibrobacter sp.]
MNKKSFLVFSACAFMLTACGGDSGSNSGSYENLDDIPNCSSKRDGDIYFVEDKNEDYVCADGKWIPLDELGKSSSSEEDELESSESKEKDLESESSSSNDLEGGSSDSKEKDLESDGSSSNDSESSSSSSKEVDSSSSSTLKELTEAVVKNASVMGSATKGPFEFGSPVYIYELHPDSLEQRTGLSYKDEISSNQGNYVVPKVTLYSPYAELVVEGKFLNEYTGKNTSKTFTLRSIADLSYSQESNINLLTHLQANRILTLVKKGYAYTAAKKQAEQELMTSFGLSNTVTADKSTIYSNATMMAISLLFIGNRNEEDIQKMIDNYIDDFAVDGQWNDSETKNEMADWVFEADWLTIHKNVDTWNITGIADFHKEILKYRDNTWGLGGCTQNRNGEATAVENENSKYYHQCFVCELRTSGDKWITDSYTWHNKSIADCDTYGWPVDSVVGAKRNGGVSGKQYVYNGKEWFQSDGDVWKDYRDDKIYKIVTIGDQTWMAENLNYDYTAESYCYKNSADSCAKYGRLYTWAAAMDSAAVFSSAGKGCGYYGTCSISGTVRGVCPEGWHLPRTDEWRTLFENVGDWTSAGTALKAATGWNSPTDYEADRDVYGFSALPAGGRFSSGGFYDAGVYAYFWSSNNSSSDDTYGMYLGYDREDAHLDYYDKRDAFSVRCLQDSN